jgi:Type II secretion system (T2SS), protein E, N-terminal domain
MVTDAPAPAAVMTRRWRVTPDHVDAAATLRDYLLRLGTSAVIRRPGTVEFDTDVAQHEIDEWVTAWVDANGVLVQLDRVELASPLLLPLPQKAEGPRLGELLVRKGLVTDEQLAWALGEARARNELLGIVLLREQLIFEDELARTLSQQLSIPYICIMQIGVNPYVARLLPVDVGEAAAAIPVKASERSVQVVFADPTDPRALAAVRAHLPEIEVAVAELSDIRAAWRTIVR